MSRSLATVLALAASFAPLAGCEPAVPDDPTWAADVAPILRASCVQCHSSPQIHDAPDSFVLDRPDGFLADDGRVLYGGRNMAFYVATRTHAGTMPPRFPLTDRQIEILTAFAALPQEDPDALAAGYGPVLGEPRPGNRAPTMRILDRATDRDGVMTLAYEIADPDRELVTGELTATGPDDEAIVVTRELYAGRGEIRWDAAAAPAGRHALVARLDDGSGAVAVALGSIAVAHVGQAPMVAVELTPDARLVTDRDAARVPAEQPKVRVTIDGAPGATPTLALAAVRGSTRVPFPAIPVAALGEQFIDWPHALVEPEGDGWRIEATVELDGYTRIVTSLAFSVGHEGAGYDDLLWADVAEIFELHCVKCHKGSGSTLHLPWDFETYAGVDGVGDPDVRGRIYRRVAVLANMPPGSAELGDEPLDPLPLADRAKLASWLLGGAPCGTGDGC